MSSIHRLSTRGIHWHKIFTFIFFLRKQNKNRDCNPLAPALYGIPWTMILYFSDNQVMCTLFFPPDNVYILLPTHRPLVYRYENLMMGFFTDNWFVAGIGSTIPFTCIYDYCLICRLLWGFKKHKTSLISQGRFMLGVMYYLMKAPIVDETGIYRPLIFTCHL